MQDTLIKSLKSGLYGIGTHIDPKQALVGLNSNLASVRPKNVSHSCWDLLHHMVVWQDAIIEALKEKKVDWDEVSNIKNWPPKDDKPKRSDLDKLITRFEQGLIETEKLIETTDFVKSIPSWETEPNIRAFFILLQHNSYHTGQIVSVRQFLGCWPPS